MTSLQQLILVKIELESLEKVFEYLNKFGKKTTVLRFDANGLLIQELDGTKYIF